jgi:hypothetical protein
MRRTDTRQTRPSRWQIRLLAGAVGALFSALAGLITAPSVIGLIFGVVGIPVGALLGLCYGPELVDADVPDPVVQLVAKLATLLGTVAIAVGFAFTQSRGASIAETLELGFVGTVLLGLVSVPLGYPMARIVGRMATTATRRLAAKAPLLWLPSGVFIGMVATGTVLLVTSQVHPEGATAAYLGDRVGFAYVVRDQSPESAFRSLETRSYLDGQLASSNSFGIGSCGSGTGDLLGSDWAVWIADDQTSWEDQPSERPLVTSAAFGAEAGEPVQVTIDIDPQGQATWHRGLDGGAECPGMP